MISELHARYPVVIEIPVAWGEMDSFQHVNNAVYFKYLESARVEYFRRLKLMELMKQTSIGPILGAIKCRFRNALVYPDNISVATRISQINSDRFTMEGIIVSHTHNYIAAESEGIVVMLNYANQKKAPIPEEVLARINELERSKQ